MAKQPMSNLVFPILNQHTTHCPTYSAEQPMPNLVFPRTNMLHTQGSLTQRYTAYSTTSSWSSLCKVAMAHHRTYHPQNTFLATYKAKSTTNHIHKANNLLPTSPTCVVIHHQQGQHNVLDTWPGSLKTIYLSG